LQLTESLTKQQFGRLVKKYANRERKILEFKPELTATDSKGNDRFLYQCNENSITPQSG
jgi:hypothetical protein